MELAIAQLQLWTQVKADLQAIPSDDTEDTYDNGDNDDNDNFGANDTDDKDDNLTPSAASSDDETGPGPAPGSPFRGGEVLAF
jgi:hypothetical protein